MGTPRDFCELFEPSGGLWKAWVDGDRGGFWVPENLSGWIRLEGPTWAC